jgi:NAD+ synthetase
MSLVLLQINPTAGDFSGNLELMFQAGQQQQTAEALFFPLGAVSGYLQQMPDTDFLRQAPLALEQLGQRLPNRVLVSAYWDEAGERVFFISQDKKSQHIKAPRTQLKLKNTRALLAFQPPAAAEKIEEDCYICLSPRPYKLDPEPDPLPAASFTYGQSDLVGGQDTLVFSGQSAWITPQGQTIAAPAWQPGAVARDQAPAPPIRLDPMAGLHRALLSGIGDYARKNHFPSVIVGLSGGVDSALTTLLATQALGADKVHALTMPSPYSSGATRRDARALAANLGIKIEEIAIAPVMLAFNQALNTSLGSAPPGLEQENLQARIRSCLLMTLANRFGHLLLATSNRSEAMTGYATLYGDMTGGLAPIAHLYKNDIYKLCAHIDPHHKIIPPDIITRAPSAELSPGQTDQDTLPPSPVLDKIREGICERRLSSQQLQAQGLDGAVIARVMELMAASQYKRQQAPPALNFRNSHPGLPLTGVRNFVS